MPQSFLYAKRHSKLLRKVRRRVNRILRVIVPYSWEQFPVFETRAKLLTLPCIFPSIPTNRVYQHIRSAFYSHHYNCGTPQQVDRFKYVYADTFDAFFSCTHMQFMQFQNIFIRTLRNLVTFLLQPTIFLVMSTVSRSSTSRPHDLLYPILTFLNIFPHLHYNIFSHFIVAVHNVQLVDEPSVRVVKIPITGVSRLSTFHFHSVSSSPSSPSAVFPTFRPAQIQVPTHSSLSPPSSTVSSILEFALDTSSACTFQFSPVLGNPASPFFTSLSIDVSSFSAQKPSAHSHLSKSLRKIYVHQSVSTPGSQRSQRLHRSHLHTF